MIEIKYERKLDETPSASFADERNASGGDVGAEVTKTTTATTTSKKSAC